MTIQAAMDMADQMKPNMMTERVKRAYLTEIDQLIYEEVVVKHEPMERQRVNTLFLKNISERIEDELVLQSAQDKEDVVDFINKIRGMFHQEIIYMQAKMPDTMFDYMTEIEEALEQEVKKQDQYSKTQLVSFLETINGIIKAKLNEGHKPPVYDDDTDPGTEMLVPPPYDMLYVYWLMSKIDLLNQEMDKYNNDRAMFENAYYTMQDWWNRTRMPVQRHRQIHI